MTNPDSYQSPRANIDQIVADTVHYLTRGDGAEDFRLLSDAMKIAVGARFALEAVLGDNGTEAQLTPNITEAAPYPHPRCAMIVNDGILDADDPFGMVRTTSRYIEESRARIINGGE